jgi:hypothetical protein
MARRPARNQIKRRTHKQAHKRSRKQAHMRYTRRHRGGNYESDITVGSYEGEPIKAPNTVTVSHNGQIMSVTSLLNKLNDFILHGPDY